MKNYLLLSINLLIVSLTFSQDTIVLSSGEKIFAKVTDVSLNTIRYKKTVVNSISYSLLSSDIDLIKYANGNIMYFNNSSDTPPPPPPPPEIIVQNDTILKVDKDDIIFFSILTISKDDQIFFDMNRNGKTFDRTGKKVVDTSAHYRKLLLEKVGERYKVNFTVKELDKFDKESSFGMPIANIKKWLNTNDPKEKEDLQTGIPNDSTDNQLALWIRFAHLTNPNLIVNVMSDKGTSISKIKEIINLLKDNKISFRIPTINYSYKGATGNQDQDIIVEDTQLTTISETNPILLIVEVMPIYDGGENALNKFLADNIIYPANAKQNNVEGTVVVQFVVETDGSISNITLLKDIGDGCGDEALRVVRKMPKWIPGKQNGVAVRVQYQLPVRFTLN